MYTNLHGVGKGLHEDEGGPSKWSLWKLQLASIMLLLLQVLLEIFENYLLVCISQLGLLKQNATG